MADKPDKWSILNDYGKTVITLASALLAIAVTFSDKLAGVNQTDWNRKALYGLWIALLLAEITGVWLLAALFGLLRRKEELGEISSANSSDAALNQRRTKLTTECKTWERALRSGTFVSYISLVAVAVCLCALGFGSQRDAPLVKLIGQARTQIAALRQLDVKSVQLIRLVLLPPGDTYRVEFSSPNQATPCVIEIDAKTGEIRSLH